MYVYAPGSLRQQGSSVENYTFSIRSEFFACELIPRYLEVIGVASVWVSTANCQIPSTQTICALILHLPPPSIQRQHQRFPSIFKMASVSFTHLFNIILATD